MPKSTRGPQAHPRWRSKEPMIDNLRTLEELVQQLIVGEFVLIDAVEAITREQRLSPLLPEANRKASGAEREVLVAVGNAGISAVHEAAHPEPAGVVLGQ